MPFPPSPSPLSLSWNLSTFLWPLLLKERTEQLQRHSSRLVRPPSGRRRLTLMGDKPRRQRLTSYPADLVQGLPTDRRFKRGMQVQASYPVVTGSLILLTFSPLFPAAKRSPMGTGWSSRFLYTWTCERPLVGCGPTQDGRWLVQALSPQWAGDRVRPPSLALSGSVWLGVWTDTRRGWGGMAISLYFSVFPVPPAFTSPSVLSPYSRPLYPENSVSLSVIIGIFVK